MTEEKKELERCQRYHEKSYNEGNHVCFPIEIDDGISISSYLDIMTEIYNKYKNADDLEQPSLLEKVDSIATYGIKMAEDENNE